MRAIPSFLVAALVAASGLLVAPLIALGDSGFRCRSGRLVSVGDRMKDVRDRCGDPDAVVQRVDKRKVRHRYTRRIGDLEESVIEEHEVEIPIEEWTYDMGRNAFTRYVVFEHERVAVVLTGDYGSQ